MGSTMVEASVVLNFVSMAHGRAALTHKEKQWLR
jgi:hypothetical protein